MDVGAAVGLSLWVHPPEWEVVDGQVPEPAPGVVLGAAAIALQGRSEPLEADAFESGGPQGVVLVNGPTSSEASAEYVITGMVVKAGDMLADYGQGATHVGVELVLQVDDWQLYARVEGRATEFSPHSRFPVRVRVSCISSRATTRTSWSCAKCAPTGRWRRSDVSPTETG